MSGKNFIKFNSIYEDNDQEMFFIDRFLSSSVNKSNDKHSPASKPSSTSNFIKFESIYDTNNTKDDEMFFLDRFLLPKSGEKPKTSSTPKSGGSSPVKAGDKDKNIETLPQDSSRKEVRPPPQKNKEETPKIDSYNKLDEMVKEKCNEGVEFIKQIKKCAGLLNELGKLKKIPINITLPDGIQETEEYYKENIDQLTVFMDELLSQLDRFIEPE